MPFTPSTVASGPSSGPATRPLSTIAELMDSSRFRDDAAALGARLGRGVDEVVAETRVYLDEMTTTQSSRARDLWAHLARFLWGRAYELDVDRAGLERIRELNRSYPVVFLPSHKSNLDGFVMASVMYDNSFPATHVLGGINMAFWPLGTLGRRVGVIWIRRSFGDNEIYKFALRRYLAHLASKRFNLEWYIEGGRSRTGKLLPPRMGLLSYLAQGTDEARVDEVYLAPVAIIYDRLNEVIEMTAESRGTAKRPEGLGWLLRYARTQRGKLGRIQVRFGDPVPLRRALAEVPAGDRAARQLALSKVGFEVCTRINRVTPVTPIAIATLALLGTDGRAVTPREAGRAIAPLTHYVRLRDLPGTETLSELETGAGLDRVLRTLVEHGVVEVFTEGEDPVYRIGPDRELAAAFYRNMVIHWFVNRAIVELALVVAAESDAADAMEAALDQAFRLRDLLKFEFFFAEKAEFRDELRDEVGLVDPAWRAKGGAGLHALGSALAESGDIIADRILRSFVEAYWVVAHRLATQKANPVDGTQLVLECLAVSRQYHLQRRILRAEAISSELFKTGVKLAANRGLLSPDTPDLGRARAAFADELAGVLRALEVLRRLDAELRLKRQSADVAESREAG